MSEHWELVARHERLAEVEMWFARFTFFVALVNGWNALTGHIPWASTFGFVIGLITARSMQLSARKHAELASLHRSWWESER